MVFNLRCEIHFTQKVLPESYFFYWVSRGLYAASSQHIFGSRKGIAIRNTLAKKPIVCMAAGIQLIQPVSCALLKYYN